MKCPGTDTRYWKETDIFEVPCPKCKTPIEFFKDDSHRVCSKCRQDVFNPVNRTDCLMYCEYADKCKILLNK